jgi:hypothetical protein
MHLIIAVAAALRYVSDEKRQETETLSYNIPILIPMATPSFSFLLI